MKKRKKGYVLLIILILSIIIALIGAGLAFMSKQGFLSTRANTLFNRLQKAAHYGINEATRRIVEAGGFCEEAYNLPINIDGVNVISTVARRGILCALRSEATLGGARAVIVASTQGFYGIGTFTVKANERVQWLGNAFVSGCDLQNNCTIPGIIVRGPIEGVPPNMIRTCDQQTGTNPGIYGSPPTKPNVKFYDLVPLTFNVNCFYELLTMFEGEDNYTGYPMGLGKNPLWRDINNNARQDITFDKGGLTSCFGIEDEPKIVWENRTGDFVINFPSGSEIPSSMCNFDEDTLDLSKDLLGCTWIRLQKNVTITGIAPSVKFLYGPNRRITINDAGNVNIITNERVNIIQKTNTYPLTLYTTDRVNINGYTTYVRIVSQNDIRLNTSSTISYSTLITPNSVINDSEDGLTIRESNVFARRVHFTRSTTIEGGMFYLFGYVESVCNSSDPDSSRITTSANIGTLDNPVLFIMVNSNLRVVNPSPIYFNGIFFAEGPTCIVYSNIRFVGISIWNEPNDFENVDQLGSGFYIQFNYGIINILNTKFWFVRKFECIKDDPLPYAQAIQTYHSSY